MKNKLRIEIIMIFIISAGISILLFSIVNPYVIENEISYNSGIQKINWKAKEVALQIEKNKTKIQQVLNEQNEPDMAIYVVNKKGEILYDDDNGEDQKAFNILAIEHSEQNREKSLQNENDIRHQTEYTAVYPLHTTQIKGYVLINGEPKGELVHHHLTLLTYILCFGIFVAMIYFFTRKIMKDLESISKGLQKMTEGDLSTRIKCRSENELGTLAKEINLMAKTLEEKNSKEKELITNVSHDLKTPLTSILGYIELIRSKKYKNQTEYEKYLSIVSRQALHLDQLIRSLFEYTRLKDPELSLKRGSVDIYELVRQVTEETIAQHHMDIIKKIPINKSYKMSLDSEKIVRVLDNLYHNAIQYAADPKKIEIEMRETEKVIEIIIKNTSSLMKENEIENVFERFYRGEPSRNQKSGGSGLGLAISKEIIQKHKGKMEAAYKKPNFIIKIELPKN